MDFLFSAEALNISDTNYHLHDSLKDENDVLDRKTNLTFPILSPQKHAKKQSVVNEIDLNHYPAIDFKALVTPSKVSGDLSAVDPNSHPTWNKTNFLDSIETPSNINGENESNHLSSAGGDFSSIEIIDNVKMQPSYTSFDTDENSESGASVKSGFPQSSNIDIPFRPALEKGNSKSSVGSLDQRILDRNNSDSGNNPVSCLWKDCHIVVEHAKLLYKHICEVHIGRKRPPNYEYSCLWGNCKHPMTYKRDHLVSHVMVHVPMKNFSCDTCDKKFKRSHDLKKHILIHLKKKLKSNNKHKTIDKNHHQNSKISPSKAFLQPENGYAGDGKFYHMPSKEFIDELSFQYQQLQYNYYNMLQMQQHFTAQHSSYPSVPSSFGSMPDKDTNSFYPDFTHNLEPANPYGYSFQQVNPAIEHPVPGVPAFAQNSFTSIESPTSMHPSFSSSRASQPQNLPTQAQNLATLYPPQPPFNTFTDTNQSIYGDYEDYSNDSSALNNQKSKSTDSKHMFFNLNSSSNIARNTHPEKYSNHQKATSNNKTAQDIEKIRASLMETASKSNCEFSSEEVADIFDHILSDQDLSLFQGLLQYLKFCRRV